MKGHVRSPAGSCEIQVYMGKDRDTAKPRYRTRTVGGSRADAERALERFVHEVAPFGALLERWYRQTPTTSLPASRAEVRRLIDYRLVPLARLEPTTVGLVAAIVAGAFPLDGTE